MDSTPAQFDAQPHRRGAAVRKAAAAVGVRRKREFELVSTFAERQNSSADAATVRRLLASLIAREILAEGQRGAND